MAQPRPNGGDTFGLGALHTASRRASTQASSQAGEVYRPFRPCLLRKVDRAEFVTTLSFVERYVRQLGRGLLMPSTTPGGDRVDSLDGGMGSDQYDNDTSDTLAVGTGDSVLANVFASLPSWDDTI